MIKESRITKAFSNDNPEIDVKFFNESDFPSLMLWLTTPDLVKQALERRGIADDELFIKVLMDIRFEIATKFHPNDERYAAIYGRYALLHQSYKELMTKALEKKAFSKSELNNISLLLSNNPNIRVTAEDGRLLINEDPEAVILCRLAEGIVDVANGDKDIRICAATDCNVAFVPVRKNQKYHSRSCANRTYKRLERNKE